MELVDFNTILEKGVNRLKRSHGGFAPDYTTR